jgi:hypothetical protein
MAHEQNSHHSSWGIMPLHMLPYNCIHSSRLSQGQYPMFDAHRAAQAQNSGNQRSFGNAYNLA